MMAPEQIQQPSPMVIGAEYSRSWYPSGYWALSRSSGRYGWFGVARVTLAPTQTPSPSVIGETSRKVQP